MTHSAKKCVFVKINKYDFWNPQDADEKMPPSDLIIIAWYR